jgi:hypothetical protein
MVTIQSYEISDVSEKLYAKLSIAWCTTISDLQSILETTKQSGDQKTVKTATYNNVRFDRKDILEIEQFIEIREKWFPPK